MLLRRLAPLRRRKSLRRIRRQERRARQEAHRRQSLRQKHRARPASRSGSVQQSDGLHRHRQKGKGQARRRRQSRRRQGLLHRAHRFRRRTGQHEDRAGRNLRPGDVHSEIQGHQRSRRARQQIALWPRRRRMDFGHHQGSRHRRRRPRRYRVGQLLRRLRRRRPIRRIQAVRHRPRTRRIRPRQLHPGKTRHRQALMESLSRLRTSRAGLVPARFFLSTLFLFALATAPLLAQDSSLAHRRAAHLRYGINLSEWFAQVYDPKGYTKEHFEAWTTPQDIALIKSIGFDHVRLSVNPAPMFRRNEADRIPADYLAMLDGAVNTILAQNLAVIIDVHPESDFKQKFTTDDSFVEQFEDFWRQLARHYSSTNPDLVFFEILNEPEFRDRYRWEGVQSRLAMAIREGAPRHTIIAAGANWSSENELLFIEPLRDPNIIYNFHFYDPHIFTHQGANWTTNFQHYLENLPYPSTPGNVQQSAALIPDAVNRLAVVHYGLDRWNAERVEREIGLVAAWAKRWGVPVTCNEFGVYRKTANPQDRARWLSDVRSTFEKYDIGWTMWDYSGGFGVVT